MSWKTKMKEKVLDFLRNKFNQPIDENSFLAEFSEDSMSRVEILFELERLIGKKLNEEDILNIETVQDLINVVSK